MSKHTMWNTVWEEIFSSQAWGKYPAEPLIRFVAKNFYTKDRGSVRFLELGCGPGANLWFLAREGFSFKGIDGSESAVQQATTRLDAECPGWRSRGEVVVGDIATNNFGEQAFDAVIDNECVYCMPLEKSCEIYSRARTALRPGGKLFVRTFATETWGFNTGEKIGDFTFECDQGPLAKKGVSRFTTKNQISMLLRGYKNISIEKTITTHLDGEKMVAEWIIEAEK